MEIKQRTIVYNADNGNTGYIVSIKSRSKNNLIMIRSKNKTYFIAENDLRSGMDDWRLTKPDKLETKGASSTLEDLLSDIMKGVPK